MKNQIVRKLSTKTIGFDKKAIKELVEKSKEETIPLYTFVGIVRAIENVETTYGNSVKLKGQFQAKNLHTGIELKSSVAYLPQIVTDIIEGSKEEESELQLAITVNADKDESGESNVGYTYSFNTHIEQEHNPLEKLMKALPNYKS